MVKRETSKGFCGRALCEVIVRGGIWCEKLCAHSREQHYNGVENESGFRKLKVEGGGWKNVKGLSAVTKVPAQVEEYY